MQDYTTKNDHRLPTPLKSLADETCELLQAMADNDCVESVLVLANDHGATTIYPLPVLLHESPCHPMVVERVEEFKQNNRLVALCLAVPAWMCDENNYREFMNLDEYAAVEHLTSSGLDQDSATAAATDLIQNLLMNTAHLYHALYGNLAMMPFSFEGIPVRIESIWGVYHRTCEILRGVDEMALSFRTDWRQMAAPGGAGMYTDLLQLEPGK